MSFTEFSYQLIQGYDFYYLWKNQGVKLQMGGSDQWGNIVTGTELIRKKDGGEAFALTTQLIKKSDGTKFGKTEGGNIWLDKNKTSPYKFYQFWLNASDDDAANYIKIFTLKTKEEIDSIIAEHSAEPHLRKLQKALADDITVRVHSQEDLQKAIDASNILFGQSTTEQLKSLSEQDILEIFEGVPMFEVPKDILENSEIVSILAEHTKVFPSKGEARKNIEANAVSINKEKVSLTTKIESSQFLNGKFLIAQKGKKNYFLIKAI
jgi:tyrosyl-tRNA synthetase